MRILVAVLFVTQAVGISAIIPMPCANRGSLESRTCCPTPDKISDSAGPCGANLNRGRCVSIAIPESEFNAQQTDVRKNWPIQYFQRVCVCNANFAGFDCGECSYGYNDGKDCTEKTILPRKSLAEMGDGWGKYRDILLKIKSNPSRYMVATTDFTASDLEAVVNSLVRPTTYDLFIWLHHFVAKDNDFTDPNNQNIVDFAHEGTGFPTWHRLFLLWLEREIQIEIGDRNFRLPYWDWSHESNRELPFTKDRLGENVNSVVEGTLFKDQSWKTRCWVDPSTQTYPVPICDPEADSNQELRRCPNAHLCGMYNTNWPSVEDVQRAVLMGTYDNSPYDRFVKNGAVSFRNYLEGFVTTSGSDCGSDTLCTVHDDTEEKVTVSRKLHNAVHIILGVGDVTSPQVPFSEAGVMSCVAASPNDPVFINHHANVDCILEQWLTKNNFSLSYPHSREIREGHRANDYIVPFMPLYTHEQMFQTADNFGYRCSTLASQAYVALIISMLLAVASITVT